VEIVDVEFPLEPVPQKKRIGFLMAELGILYKSTKRSKVDRNHLEREHRQDEQEWP